MPKNGSKPTLRLVFELVLSKLSDLVVVDVYKLICCHLDPCK